MALFKFPPTIWSFFQLRFEVWKLFCSCLIILKYYRCLFPQMICHCMQMRWQCPLLRSLVPVTMHVTCPPIGHNLWPLVNENICLSRVQQNNIKSAIIVIVDYSRVFWSILRCVVFLWFKYFSTSTFCGSFHLNYYEQFCSYKSP